MAEAVGEEPISRPSQQQQGNRQQAGVPEVEARPDWSKGSIAGNVTDIPELLFCRCTLARS